MANLSDSAASWEAGVYQIETTDPVVGGAPNPGTGAGMSNIPHLQLAMRTVWLKAQVEAALASLLTKAPLASPALTGNPTAPTQTAGNNSTRIATTEFVQAAITALIGGAPGALDTLNELAAALADDASFAATMTTQLGLKAPLASPALTGNPTAPTQTAGNNSTRIATTAFVQAAVGATVGIGQSWQDVSGSRAHSTSYQNTSGAPICIRITADGGTLQASTNGSTWVTLGALGATEYEGATAIIPNNHYYRVNGSATIATWVELRA